MAEWITAAEVCVSAHHLELQALVSRSRTLGRRVRDHTDDRIALAMVENLLCDLMAAENNARRLLHAPRKSDRLVRGVRAARHRPMTADDVLAEQILSAVIHAQVCTGQQITQAGYDRAVAILAPLCDIDPA